MYQATGAAHLGGLRFFKWGASYSGAPLDML